MVGEEERRVVGPGRSAVRRTTHTRQEPSLQSRYSYRLRSSVGFELCQSTRKADLSPHLPQLRVGVGCRDELQADFDSLRDARTACSLGFVEQLGGHLNITFDFTQKLRTKGENILKPAGRTEPRRPEPSPECACPSSLHLYLRGSPKSTMLTCVVPLRHAAFCCLPRRDARSPLFLPPPCVGCSPDPRPAREWSGPPRR